MESGFKIKNKVGLVTDLNFYFTAALSAGICAVVESVAVTATESTITAVESVVSVAVDPEPHAVSVSATPSAKINVYFFI
jgi:hypothetical protein